MLGKLFLTTAVVLAAIHRTSAQACPRWTRWLDKDDPGDNDGGDFEMYLSHKLQACPDPTAIEARVVGANPPLHAGDTGEVFAFYNTVMGFICIDEDQKDGPCRDYEVRFCCPLPECPRWEGWYDSNTPGQDDLELLQFHQPENCAIPTYVQARTVAGHVDALLTLNKIEIRYVGDPIGFSCWGADQLVANPCEDYEVRYCCPPLEIGSTTEPGIAATPQPCSIDIVIVIDVSSSIPRSDEFHRILLFLIEFIQCFDGVDVRIGIVTYDCLPTLDVPLGEFPLNDPSLLDAIIGLERRGGSSRTGLALHYVKCMTDFRNDTWSVVILVSDGTETNGQGTDDYLAQAGMLRDSGFAMYGVAVGYPFLVNKAGLGTIVGGPDRVVDPNDPCTLANRIIEECCGVI